MTPSREEQKNNNFAAYDYHDDLDCSKRLRHYFFSYIALPNRIDGNRWECINFIKVPAFLCTVGNVDELRKIHGKYREHMSRYQPLNYKFCGLPTPLGWKTENCTMVR